MRTEATSMLITTARIRKRPEHVFQENLFTLIDELKCGIKLCPGREV
jgi:hypothetical protein